MACQRPSVLPTEILVNIRRCLLGLIPRVYIYGVAEPRVIADRYRYSWLGVIEDVRRVQLDDEEIIHYPAVRANTYW